MVSNQADRVAPKRATTSGSFGAHGTCWAVVSPQSTHRLGVIEASPFAMTTGSSSCMFWWSHLSSFSSNEARTVAELPHMLTRTLLAKGSWTRQALKVIRRPPSPASSSNVSFESQNRQRLMPSASSCSLVPPPLLWYGLGRFRSCVSQLNEGSLRCRCGECNSGRAPFLPHPLSWGTRSEWTDARCSFVWAMLGSNQRPLPCEGPPGLSRCVPRFSTPC